MANMMQMQERDMILHAARAYAYTKPLPESSGDAERYLYEFGLALDGHLQQRLQHYEKVALETVALAPGPFVFPRRMEVPK